ncbi:MAG: hypothetical protein PVJ67_03840 [Candidatus Pacearchaeota archaeon]|jgi:predicted  nucleic acid-binding Zn-ribbon protein
MSLDDDFIGTLMRAYKKEYKILENDINNLRAVIKQLMEDVNDLQNEVTFLNERLS